MSEIDNPLLNRLNTLLQQLDEEIDIVVGSQESEETRYRLMYEIFLIVDKKAKEVWEKRLLLFKEIVSQ